MTRKTRAKETKPRRTYSSWHADAPVEGASLHTLIPLMPDGATIIVPVMTGKSVSAVQQSLNGIQQRHPICLKTKQVIIIDKMNPTQVSQGIQVTIQRLSA